MAFGNSLSQNEPENCKYPSPNNFCGGFALNAVLAEIISEFNNPMTVYCKIQEYQTYNVAGNGYKFLHDTRFIVNGTLMSLPSGICSAFNSFPTDKKISVYYTTIFEHTPIFEDLIKEEHRRIEALGITVNPNRDLPKEGWTHVLILVNGRHWIAVKRIEEGEKFICYDPGEGKNSEGDTMEKAIENLEEEYEISGLYICIPKTI